MDKLRSVKSRLQELKSSREYRTAFAEIKDQILSRPTVRRGRVTFSQISDYVSKKRLKFKPASCGTLNLDEAFIAPFFIAKVLCRGSETTGFLGIEDVFIAPTDESEEGAVIYSWASKDRQYMNRIHSLKEVQKILKTGNVNRWRIVIPAEFEEFGKRWEVRFLCDPSKAFPHAFDPFSTQPIKQVHPNRSEEYDPYKLLLEVDVRYPIKEVLLPQFKSAIRVHEIINGLDRGRKERYSDDEIFRVKRMLDQKKGDLQIFHELYPEHSSFHPKAYLQGSKEGREILREEFKKFRKVQRLIRRAKEREK